MFNAADFEKHLLRYPMLERLLRGGVLTKKIMRSVLEFDKMEADTLHGNLVYCGAIKITSPVMFRATEPCLFYLEEMCNGKNDDQ